MAPRYRKPGATGQGTINKGARRQLGEIDKPTPEVEPPKPATPKPKQQSRYGYAKGWKA